MDGRLFKAAIEGNREMLRKLLDEDPPIDLDRVMNDCRGKDNPLHVGALYGHVEFVGEILRRKPELTRELNSEGQSPLHLASARGHVEVVKEILSKDADACFIRDQDGMIPLHLAAIKGRLDVLETLVEAKKITAFVLTKSGEPILHLCAKKNKFKALEKLVELVTDDKFVNMKDSDDNTILHVLSAMNHGKVKALHYEKPHKTTCDWGAPGAPEIMGAVPIERMKDPGEKALGMMGGFDDGLACIDELIRLLVQNGTVDVNAVNIDGSMPLDVSIGKLRSSQGWDTDFNLIDAGAKRSVPIFRIGLNWLIGSWFNEALLVVAILVVTVAFQAGINPPGGVWQDTGYHNATLPNAPQSSPPKLVHHYAGQSVMSHVDPKIYKAFFFLNYFTFFSSIFVIVLLLKECFVKSPFYKLLAICFTFISVCTMSGAYVVSLPYLSREESDSPILSLVLFKSILFVVIIWPPNLHVVWYETFGWAPGHRRTTSVRARAVGRP